MGGFVDPFTAAPAWSQDLAFAGSSWSSGSGASSLADSAELEFHHLENGSSSALLNKEAASPPLELHGEQFLQQQLRQGHLTHGLSSFAVDSALMAGTLGELLSTPCAPTLCGSNNDSSGSEESGLLPPFLLGEQHQVPAPAVAWSSAFSQIASSLDGEETSQTSFGFGSLSNGDLLHENCIPDGKKYLQLGNVSSAPLHLQEDVKYNTGNMLSFAPGQQQLKTNFENLQIDRKEFSGLHHLNLSSLVSGQLSAFNATGTALDAKQSNEVRGGINVPTTATSSEAPNGNVAAGNGGVSKPRVRARRGQATDPHSIAERLRREKISDRMKNLQELVPNSNKTDKASMLDEIIDYVKFLQLQVKVLSMSRLGATEAVVPLLTESQTESSGLLLSPKSGSKRAGEDVLGHGQSSELRDGAAFEQEVVQLMENSMTTAMQYLQSKGLCLIPIALASAISDQKGTSSAAVRPVPDNSDAADDGGDVKKVPEALKQFGIAMEMRSRA